MSLQIQEIHLAPLNWRRNTRLHVQSLLDVGTQLNRVRAHDHLPVAST